ncbi:sensor histidine kinase [Spongiimicrobium salis]|uniref:sensor histidine kinase n=1 Tax=Spongiimicrobium salis TaxID=1667022 RepID=UPI00374D65CC
MEELNSFNFEKASEIAKKFEDKTLGLECIQLSRILFEAGQNTSKVYIDYASQDIEGSKKNVLSLLSKGYDTLYKNPYTSMPYRFFSEALIHSNELNDESLIKFSLLSIIQVYNWEFSQSNDDVLEFLHLFKSFIKDDTDRYHFMINKFLYHLREISKKPSITRDDCNSFAKLMESFPENHRFWPNYYSTMGVVHKYFKDNVKAISFHTKAVHLTKDLPFLKYVKFRSLIHLSFFETSENNFEKALDYISLASEYSSFSDPKRDQSYIANYRADNYAGMRMYKKAYEEKKKADDIIVSLGYDKNSLEIANLNLKYRTTEKERENLELTNQNLIIKNKAEQNFFWLVILISVLIFGTGIAVLLQKNSTKKRKLAEQQALLEQQKTETLLKDQELLSIDAMIAGQEKERQRVANELHDDLGSKMATIKLHVENIKTDKEDPSFKHATKLLEEAYQKIRGISHVKNSGVIAKQGLLRALQGMARTISETNKIQLTVHDFGLENRMENSLELNIFRMVQEIVTNIIKHAEASKGCIQLTQHEESLNIMIEDNGKGFDPTSIRETDSGIGLRNIEKRIEHLEGNFTIDSALGNGTSIIIDIPI